jgi:NADH-quinone oxidoreductase subunit M
MILMWLVIAPIAGGGLAAVTARWNALAARCLALAGLAADLALVVLIWLAHAGQIGLAQPGRWLVVFDAPWVPALGIHFHLALDGLSLLLVGLAAFLGMIAIAASWNDAKVRDGFYLFCLLWVLAAMIGVFLALDLFLFYFIWELMLLPMFFLIAVWGHERRTRAAIKFFLLTQVSGLLMLVAILGLYFIHGRATGTYTFDYDQLLGTSMPAGLALWLMLGFFIAFAVKLPVFPVHSWLPDAYVESPTSGTVVLAGVMSKTAAYGLLRFVVPLFPASALYFRPVAMALAVAGLLYGAIVAFGQTDFKRLIAFMSFSHMGFILLGVFAWNELALQGVVVEVLAHGVTIAALFILLGALESRTGTRDMGQLEGLWSTIPRLSGSTMVFVLAALGLPGLGNFVGEFLILLGTYQVNRVAAIIAALGLVASVVYALWLVQCVLHGSNRRGWRLADITLVEAGVALPMMAAIVWLGLFPQPVLNTAQQALVNLQQIVAAGGP